MTPRNTSLSTGDRWVNQSQIQIAAMAVEKNVGIGRSLEGDDSAERDARQTQVVGVGLSNCFFIAVPSCQSGL